MTATPPPFETSPALARLDGVGHGFFGRRGGVSSGIYAGLNVGPGSGDAPNDVAENRRRASAALSANPDQLLTPYQIHSARAVIVDAPWDGPRPEADAVVTATPGLLVGVLTADCAPVLLADADAGVVAAAHAGWRGAFGGITDAAIAAMESLGAERGRIVAAIGPCIGQAAYEVGPEFKERFLAASPRNAALFRPGAGDRSHFDLPGYVARRLGEAGLGRVDALAACTMTDGAAWFSHRRAVKHDETDHGRNLSAIMVRRQ